MTIKIFIFAAILPVFKMIGKIFLACGNFLFVFFAKFLTIMTERNYFLYMFGRSEIKFKWYKMKTVYWRYQDA